MPHTLSDQSYGKCCVRLTKVSREGQRHSIVELTADIELDGDLQAAFSLADNRLVVPTDTMKNTVYVLARQHDMASIESFGQRLAKYFIGTFNHLTRATVRLREQPWQRMVVDGAEHNHAFSGVGGERHTAVVTCNRGSLTTTSGLEGLAVVKTTGSGFSGFLRDRYTTLPDTDDRIFGTAITATWGGEDQDVDWPLCRQMVRGKLLEVFATHDSKSVQHTLYAMASSVLDACQMIQSITLQMPNQHRVLVDLGPFGLTNPNEIFVPTAEPYGMIRATVKRETRP